MDTNKNNITNSDYIPYILIAIIVVSYTVFFIYTNKPSLENDSDTESDENEDENEDKA